jgi:hypothetical protein
MKMEGLDWFHLIGAIESRYLRDRRASSFEENVLGVLDKCRDRSRGWSKLWKHRW